MENFYGRLQTKRKNALFETFFTSRLYLFNCSILSLMISSFCLLTLLFFRSCFSNHHDYIYKWRINSWESFIELWLKNSKIVTFCFSIKKCFDLKRKSISPVIWAIRSRSCPSGLESTSKLACRICNCSSVNVVRTLLALPCFPSMIEW